MSAGQGKTTPAQERQVPAFPAPDQDLPFTTTVTCWGVTSDTLHSITENSGVCADGSHHHGSSRATSTTLHGTLPLPVSISAAIHRAPDTSAQLGRAQHTQVRHSNGAQLFPPTSPMSSDLLSLLGQCLTLTVKLKPLVWRGVLMPYTHFLWRGRGSASDSSHNLT